MYGIKSVCSRIAVFAGVVSFAFLGCSDSAQKHDEAPKASSKTEAAATATEKKSAERGPEADQQRVAVAEKIAPNAEEPVKKDVKTRGKSALALEKEERTKPRPKIEGNPGQSRKAKKPAIKPETILARVNGVDITWRSLSRYTDMMVALLKNRRKNHTPEDIQRFKKKFTPRFSSDLLQRTLLTTCLSASNIVVTAAMKAQVERDFVRNYGMKGQKFEDLKALLGKEGFAQELDEALKADMTVKQFLTTVHSNDYFVSEKEIKDVRRGMEMRNRIAVETNKLQVARAEKILAEIRKGGDFAKLADRYSQDNDRGNDPNEKKAAEAKPAEPGETRIVGGDIGECDESDFVTDKHVWQQLSRMKEGEVTGLLELEDGYAIYKVVKVNSLEESNSGDKSLKLARIFLRRAYEFPEQTDGELRVDLEREKRGELNAKVYRAFRRLSTVEYPDGHISM